MATIKLSNSNKEVLIDDRNYERVSKYRWYGTGSNWQTIMSTSQPSFALANFILNSYNVIIDHKNGNPYDFREENLREATRSQNNCNRSKQDIIFKPCSSQYKGVVFYKKNKKWMAKIKKDSKTYYLGCFQTEKDAATAYNEAAIKLHGEFAKLNEI